MSGIKFNMSLCEQYRNFTCGELSVKNIDQEVTLSGWVFRIRDHGGLLFVDLRDVYGITQICFDGISEASQIAEKTSLGSVVSIFGRVKKRIDGAENLSLNTGEIEIEATKIVILSKSEVAPFPPDADFRNMPSEEQRLQYRFLDLRRPDMQHIMLMRCRFIQALRESMLKRGFNEFQTPILTSTSPEGARDYLVPSRLSPGNFYALPQAPQQFKQFLMIAGFDKYFQIAPCFRDEDPRADRLVGTFYQLDVEMSFVTADDVMTICEEIMHECFVKFSNDVPVSQIPFPRISYVDAMNSYGCDKPDLRNPLKIKDVTNIFGNTGFSILDSSVAKGMRVRAIRLKNCLSKSRSFLDSLIQFARNIGAAGLAYIQLSEDGTYSGPPAKFMSPESLNALIEELGASRGDVILLLSDTVANSAKYMGQIRKELGNLLQILRKEHSFCWITDFPMFEKDLTSGTVDFAHNPFSQPHITIEELRGKNVPLENVFANQYDLVCNGLEVASGSIRNHDTELFYEICKSIGLSEEHVEKSFAGMLRALKYGAPPHGGFACGIERLLMILLGTENVRDVCPFPLNQRGDDIMMGAPSRPTKAQLRELGLEIVVKT